eukprot:3306486-Ditylum_brightwellii.AAC.1
MLVAEDKLLNHYNGVDYDQTHEYIKVHATKDLKKILQNKGDKTKKNKEKLIEPIHPNSVEELENTTGPEDNMKLSSLQTKKARYWIRCCRAVKVFKQANSMSLQGNQKGITIPLADSRLGDYLFDT